MAKCKVKFSVSDGKMPKKTENAGAPFALRMPMNVTVPKGSTRPLKLGITCALPCIIVRASEAKLFAPGQEFVVDLAAHNDTLVIGENEVVAHCFVIDNTHAVLVE